MSFMGESVVRYISSYALEARQDFERTHSQFCHPRDHWFFLLQSMLACSHLTEVQGCDVDTIKYAGVHCGKHVWVARS